MTKMVARNASLYIQDSTGASISVSGDLNQISLVTSIEMPDITPYTDISRVRLPGGVRDWEITFNGFYNAGAGGIENILWGITGSPTMFKFGPAGSLSGQIMFTACAILSQYAADSTVGGAVTISGTLVARTGSLTRTTW